MGRYRKILVAIDGSESSMHALRESFTLAAQEQSWITVVSVAPSYKGDLETTALSNVMNHFKRPYMDALAEAAQTAAREGALIKTVCEEGEPYERIVELSEAEGSDVIVMGRRGLRSFERVFMGSVTARVIGYSKKDTLIIPKNTTLGWQRVLLATDGSAFSDAAIERACDLVKSYGGALTVLNVVDLPSEFYGESPDTIDSIIKKAKQHVHEVQERAEVMGIKAEAVIKEGTTYEVITSLAQMRQTDTIVMGSHGRTGLKRLLMGSVTEKVIGNAPCPVLVVKPEGLL